MATVRNDASEAIEKADHKKPQSGNEIKCRPVLIKLTRQVARCAAPEHSLRSAARRTLAL